MKAPSARRTRWWALSVASMATLVVTADSGQLSIALPVIIREFNAALAGWIAMVYVAQICIYRQCLRSLVWVLPVICCRRKVGATGRSPLPLALAMAQKGTWRSPLIAVEFLGGIVVLVLFVWMEHRARFPLLDLTLFRILAFKLGNTARWISFVTMSINVLLMPFFLQLGGH